MKIQFVDFKGSKLAVFWDANNSECSFQADNIQDHEVLWLGVNQGCDGKPGFRMLLDKSRAAVIGEIIKQFLETGKTPTQPEEMPASIKSNSVDKEEKPVIKETSD